MSKITVPLEERETTVTYSVADVRKSGHALVTTYDPKLKANILRAGGKVVHTGTTTPPHWWLQIQANLLRITTKKKRSSTMTPEAKAEVALRLAKGRKKV